MGLFYNSLQLQELKYDENIGLHEFLVQYDKRLSDQCKIFAPIKNKKIIKRGTKPWNDNKLREQKKYIRKRSKIWYKYKKTHQWKAYTVERSKYNKLLYVSKWECDKNEFASNSDKTLHIYNLMAKLTDGINANPLPESTSHKDLSEEFADFFFLKIRENLDTYEKYELNFESPLFSLENFKAISELEIRNNLLTLQTKSCEVDRIPTSIIKKNFDYFIK